LLIVLSLLPRVGGKTKRRYERSAATGNTRRVEPETRAAASDDRYGTTVPSR
jgi:hypothetical protein